MMVGEVACDVPMGRTAGDAARRGRAVVACGVEAVTHFNPYQTSRVFARSLAARTHSHAPSHSRVTCALHELRTHCTHALSGTHCTALTRTTLLFFAHALFFVAIVSRNAMFALVSSTLTLVLMRILSLLDSISNVIIHTVILIPLVGLLAAVAYGLAKHTLHLF